MHSDLIGIVCCPVHKSRLQLKDEEVDDHNDVRSGTLWCGKCKFGFPIEEGIPNLLPPQFHVKAS